MEQKSKAKGRHSLLAKKVSMGNQNNPTRVNRLGLFLDEWRVDSCIAYFATGKHWATLYSIESSDEGKGHATKLLREAKTFYEKAGKRVGGSVALNPIMGRIYKRLGYIEYK